MKWKHYYLTLGVLVVACLTMVRTRSAPAETGTPEVSNYGYMRTSLEGETSAVLPLRHTAVTAEVVGVMSSVRVTQHFENPYQRPIEAVYVFPLPHRAAVHAMTMRVGERLIKAVIQKRDEARATYEKAKREGKTASLLERSGPTSSPSRWPTSCPVTGSRWRWTTWRSWCHGTASIVSCSL